ncbi:MAG: response regulator [Alphaproteobacteria bacterium]|nr:response regulator [Alphaproteobacteria bacterium]
MGGKLRSVLIVDDDPKAVEELTRYLERRGFDTLIAESGDAAVEIVRTHRIDYVLSDIRMPGIKIDVMVARMRRHDVDLPIALMTGQPGVDQELDPAHLQVDAVLKKPLNLRDIGALLKERVSQ